MKKVLITLIIIFMLIVVAGILAYSGVIDNIINKFNKTENSNIINTENTENVAKTVNQSSVVKIEKEVKNEEDTNHYLILKGLDEKSNVIWKYETKKAYAAQYENLEYFGENNGKLYINEEGTIIALDKNTGKVIWKNEDYKASGSLYTFDKEGILYLSAPVSPSLFGVDKDGNTIVKINEIDPEYLYWPDEIKIVDDNELTLYYQKNFDGMEYNEKIIFSLEEIKNKENKILAKDAEVKYEDITTYGFENIEKFNLSKDGVVTLIYKDNKEPVKLADNVKNIKYLFEGNGGFASLVMVKKDGSVLILKSEDIYNNKKMEVKELDIENVNYTIVHDGFEGEGYFVVTNSGDVFSGYDLREKE